MDFYFTNNLPRIAYKGALLSYDSSQTKWKVMSIGFPHLRFMFNNMDFVFRVFDCLSEVMILEIQFQNFFLKIENKTIIFKSLTNDENYAFSFQYGKSMRSFWHLIKKYKNIENNFLKKFAICCSDINMKLKFFKNFFENYEIVHKKHYGIFLPLVNIMFKEEFVFKFVFENYFYLSKMNYKLSPNAENLKTVQKIISIAALLFVVVDKMVLKKLLLGDFFKVIKNLINFRYQLYNKKKIDCYKKFFHFKEELLSSLTLPKISLESIIIVSRLSFVMEYLLMDLIDVKFI